MLHALEAIDGSCRLVADILDGAVQNDALDHRTCGTLSSLLRFAFDSSRPSSFLVPSHPHALHLFGSLSPAEAEAVRLREAAVARELGEMFTAASDSAIRRYCTLCLSQEDGSSGRCIRSVLESISLLIPHRLRHGLFFGDDSRSLDGGTGGLIPVSVSSAGDSAASACAFIGLVQAIKQTHGVDALLLEEDVIQHVIRSSLLRAREDEEKIHLRDLDELVNGSLQTVACQLLSEIARAQNNELGRFLSDLVFPIGLYGTLFCEYDSKAQEVLEAMSNELGYLKSQEIATLAYHARNMRVLHISGDVSLEEWLILSCLKRVATLQLRSEGASYVVYHVHQHTCLVHNELAEFRDNHKVVPLSELAQGAWSRVRFASHWESQNRFNVRWSKAWHLHKARWSQLILKMLLKKMLKSSVMIVSASLGVDMEIVEACTGFRPLVLDAYYPGLSGQAAQTQDEVDVNVIQDVQHAEIAAEIDPEEAAEVVAIQETGFVERNLHAIVETEPAEQVLLLQLNRTSEQAVMALSKGSALNACREALHQEGYSFRLASGAMVFVQPMQYHSAISAAKHSVCSGCLKSSHIVVAESLEYLVAESLAGIGTGAWVKDRRYLPQVGENMETLWSEKSDLAVPLEESINDDDSEEVCELVVQNTFLQFVPIPRPAKHSRARSI